MLTGVTKRTSRSSTVSFLVVTLIQGIACSAGKIAHTAMLNRTFGWNRTNRLARCRVFGDVGCLIPRGPMDGPRNDEFKYGAITWKITTGFGIHFRRRTYRGFTIVHLGTPSCWRWVKTLKPPCRTIWFWGTGQCGGDEIRVEDDEEDNDLRQDQPQQKRKRQDQPTPPPPPGSLANSRKQAAALKTPMATPRASMLADDNAEGLQMLGRSTPLCRSSSRAQKNWPCFLTRPIPLEWIHVCVSLVLSTLAIQEVS